ncbi:MAG: hypothetical protein DMF69_10150 [Acidobacteria bacterium]|nr:MAG: hypothetical protein DMF69_10150 [Acidobacteriota bacterium]
MNLDQLSEPQRRRIEEATKNIPYADLLGLKLNSVEPGSATMSLAVREELKQNNRVVHGGAIASLIDSAAAYAVIPLLNQNETATTVDLTISYVRPLKAGVATASAKVLRAGGRIIVISAEVLDNDGNLAATGLTTYLRLSKQ